MCPSKIAAPARALLLRRESLKAGEDSTMRLQSVLIPLLVVLSTALQLPLLNNFEVSTQSVSELLGEFRSYFQDVKEAKTYTQNPEIWPMDLSQYVGYKIIRVPINEDTLDALNELRGSYSQWEANHEFIDLKVPEEDLELLKPLDYTIIIEDLAQAVYETFPGGDASAFDIEEHADFHVASDIFFKEYRPLSTIYSWLDMMKETFPDLVEIEWLGQTFEGRDMKALHLSSPMGMNPEKKTIVLTAGVHAREWISVSTVLFTMYKLLSNFGVNKKETEYLNKLDFLVVPVFNPDGYEYSWTDDRLWRKNRQETYVPRCFGIDIDHSFDYHWTRSEDYACGEFYSGESQFEAIEAENLNHYINITKGQHSIYGFMDFHSYTQKILYPYAYSCAEQPRDIENLLELAYGLSKSIRLKSGKHYEVLPACKDRGVDILPGMGAGSSLDYMYHNRARWAFQFKLRDTGSHGFLLPSNYIVPVGDEMYRAVKYFCQFLLHPTL